VDLFISNLENSVFFGIMFLSLQSFVGTPNRRVLARCFDRSYRFCSTQSSQVREEVRLQGQPIRCLPPCA